MFRGWKRNLTRAAHLRPLLRYNQHGSMFAFTWDWQQTSHDFLRIGLAFVLALPIGLEREREEHGVGIRTFPLVAMASCGFVLLGVTLDPHDPSARSRIIQGLLAGIGFIGGGAILKSNGSVHGTATAASIWN